MFKAKHLQHLVIRYKNISFSFYNQLFQRFFHIIDACLVDAIYSYATDIQFYMYHFVWADQSENRNTSDVPGLQLVVPKKINL